MDKIDRGVITTVIFFYLLWLSTYHEDMFFFWLGMGCTIALLYREEILNL